MEISLYNVFTTTTESYLTIFKSQLQSLIQLISVLPAMERLTYLLFYLRIEKIRIQSIENYIEYLDSNPKDVESPQYDKDYWEKARVANSYYIHFLNQQIEIISLIDEKVAKAIVTKFENLKDVAKNEIAHVQVPNTLGRISNSVLYLHNSIKIRNLVNLIVHLNNSKKLPKVYLKDDLIKLMSMHFNHKGVTLNFDTLKRYFNDLPKYSEKKMGELNNEHFISEIIEFLNKVLSPDEKD